MKSSILEPVNNCIIIPTYNETNNIDELLGQLLALPLDLGLIVVEDNPPAAKLAKSHSLLKPGGYLAVYTVDIENLAARLLGLH